MLPLAGTKRNRPPPSKYLRGFTSGFRLRMWVSVRGMGTPWLSLDEEIPTWIKIFLIPRGYSCRYQKCRTTFLPTDIPIKCLDASGRGWTSGNHTGREKQRMPRSFGPWHSSLYLNLASPSGFEPLLTAWKAVTVILTDFTPLLLNYIFHIVISFFPCQKAADFDWTLCRLWGIVWGKWKRLFPPLSTD